jgi:hypothetical protein
MGTLVALPLPEPPEEPRRRRAKRRANGQGSIYQRKDGRWVGAAFVLTADGTCKRIPVYGASAEGAGDELLPHGVAEHGTEDRLDLLDDGEGRQRFRDGTDAAVGRWSWGQPDPGGAGEGGAVGGSRLHRRGAHRRSGRGRCGLIRLLSPLLSGASKRVQGGQPVGRSPCSGLVRRQGLEPRTRGLRVRLYFCPSVCMVTASPFDGRIVRTGGDSPCCLVCLVPPRSRRPSTHGAHRQLPPHLPPAVALARWVLDRTRQGGLSRTTLPK